MKKIEEDIQQKKFKSPQQKAVINLIYTANWAHSKQQAILSTFGITGQQFIILQVLKENLSKSISPTEIKSHLLDRSSDISRLLDRMMAKKLLTKKTSRKDKRAFDIFISKKGLNLLKAIDKKQKEMDTILGLSANEARQLSDLLDKSRGLKSNSQ